MTKTDYLALLLATSAAGKFPALEKPYFHWIARYRLPDGSGCVIGVALPPDVYTAELELNTLQELIDKERVTKSQLRQWTGCGFKALVKLQNYHDTRAGDDVRPWDHEHFTAFVTALFGVAP